MSAAFKNGKEDYRLKKEEKRGDTMTRARARDAEEEKELGVAGVNIVENERSI